MSRADSPPKSYSRILQFFCLLGVMAGILSLWPRWQEEEDHQVTEIILDVKALEEWARVYEGGRGALLERLKKAGISSLAFAELHLEGLESRGEVLALSPPELALHLSSGDLFAPEGLMELESFLKMGPGGTFLYFPKPALAQSIEQHLKVLSPEGVRSFGDSQVLWVEHDRRALKAEGLGFEQASLKELSEKGFRVWIRPENRVGLTSESLKRIYKQWEQLPRVQGVVFGGVLNQAFGYPDLLQESADELRRLNWKLAYIELSAAAQQKGIESLVRSLPGQTVRLMAVSPAHQKKLSPFRVLGMYSLGARERNLRALYLRPFAVPGRPELDEACIFSLPKELEVGGAASVFESEELPGPHPGVVALLCLAGAALFCAVLGELQVPLGPWVWALVGLSPLAFVLFLWLGKGVLFRALLALAISVLAPIYAALRWLYPLLVQPKDAGAGAGLSILLRLSLVSVLAGLLLAGLLSDTTFLLGLDRFRGVKLLTLGTPLLMVLAFLARHYSVGDAVKLLQTKVALYQLLAGGGLALMFGLLYLRTGNDAGGAATEWERSLRVLLDRALGVRPRFKELAVAHPALFCAPFVARQTGFLPTLVLVFLAGIGQAGIVDTFAHIHTPLDVTLTRVGLGVFFGALVGVTAQSMMRFLEQPLRKLVRN